MSTSTPSFPKTWTKGAYHISTDSSLVPLQTFNEWLASDNFYWATSLPLDLLKQTLESCLCFGLYFTPQQREDPTVPSAAEFVGIARCITDYSTFIYITDVYVQPTHQGKGLGSWLMECVGEVIDAMPYLRRSMLFTANWARSVPFYEKILGMSAMEYKKGEGMAIMMRKGRGYPSTMGELVYLRRNYFQLNQGV